MIAVISNTTGRTDLFGLLIEGSSGNAWSPAAKAFVASPPDAYLALAELPSPTPPGEYRWQDMNVPAPPSSEEFLFYVVARSGAPGAAVYTKIGEPITIAPFLSPTGVLFAPILPFFGR